VSTALNLVTGLVRNLQFYTIVVRGCKAVRCLCECMRSGCPVMYDVLALVVLACEIVSAFALAVEPELIRPGCMSVVRHNINAYL
jgi:hypothetical protein